MRASVPQPPAVLTFVFAAASLGCGACADDHLPAAPAAPEPGAVTATEVHGACALGLARPAGGFAGIVEIPSLGGNKVFVEDINDDGVAVGAESTADGVFHAIRYTDLGGVQDLGALSGFSGGQSFASAIAANGTIAGHSDRGDGSGVLYGYAFTATAGRTALCPGGCSVWDLNAAGQMVGLLPGRDPTSWQAFVTSTSGGLRPLGTLGGARSSASGISEAGLIVGNSQLASSPLGDIGHAFLYDERAEKPQMRDLNGVARAPGWVLQAANDVNEKYVVGYGLTSGNQRAFRLDLASGAVEDLGTTTGGGPSVAWSVDAYGDVVGWAESPRGGRNEALVYAAGLGGGQRLGDLVSPALGWTLVQANGINAHGSIVGWGYHQGVPRGFKLTLPVCVGK